MKELIFSISILSLILLGNNITQEYTRRSVEYTSNSLIKLKEEIDKEDKEIDVNYINDEIEDIHKEWDKKYEKLAFYIEHNELEKVETELTAVQATINTGEYKTAIPEIDKSIYILNHIKEKNSFKFKNIF